MRQCFRRRFTSWPVAAVILISSVALCQQGGEQSQVPGNADAPMRERREDIPALAMHFLSQYASRYRRQVRGVDPTALQTLLQYAWPGNVRELEHTMERAVLMCRTEQIQAGDLGIGSQRGQPQNLEELSLEAVESILIRKALQRFQGNVSQAAEALGLSRGALYRRMEKYGL